MPTGSVEIGTVWSIGAVDLQAAEVHRMKVDKKPKMKKVEITIDPRAGANCWPQGLLKKVSMQPNAKWVRFRSANGSELSRGRETLSSGSTAGSLCDLKSRVTDTFKPLASAASIGQQGGARGFPRQVVHREHRDREDDHAEGERRHVHPRR